MLGLQGGSTITRAFGCIVPKRLQSEMNAYRRECGVGRGAKTGDINKHRSNKNEKILHLNVIAAVRLDRFVTVPIALRLCIAVLGVLLRNAPPLASLSHLSEHDVLAVQPGGHHGAQEELRAIGHEGAGGGRGREGRGGAVKIMGYCQRCHLAGILPRGSSLHLSR